MVNKANIDKVIEAIRKENHPFNMSDFSRNKGYLEDISKRDDGAEILNAEFHITAPLEVNDFLNELSDNFCQTPSCICGWANYLRAKDEDIVVSLKKYRTQSRGSKGSLLLGDEVHAAKYLGISESTADALFIPASYNLHTITKSQAINALIILRDTGKVDWDTAIGGESPKYSLDGEEENVCASS